MKKLKNFIGGEWVDPISTRYFESFNPAIGEPHLLVADSDASDVEQAVQAAQHAFGPWSETKPEDRARFLYRIADLIDERQDLLAQAESSDQGKPVWLARTMDIPRAAQNFRFFAGVIEHQEDLATTMDPRTFNYVVRGPVGVAGLISPWNLPLYLLTWKIAPAIAFGNTVVAKPSEITSLTAGLLTEILTTAGLPRGVVNIVFGTGVKVGAAISMHPKIPLISFTGGTLTGRAIATAAAPLLKKTSLELGGKNANVIFSDCNLEDAVETTVRSSFLNQGEICLCGSRIYVEQSIYDRFLEKFAVRVRELKVGDPKLRTTFLGPVVSSEHQTKVLGFFETARSEAATFVTGGGKPRLEGSLNNGYFVEPTIITGVKHHSRLQQEEIFGPAVTVTPFGNDSEALELANGVSYGLSATVWTSNLNRAHGFGQKLEAGTVWVNNWMTRDLRVPFGGMKASGVGREGQQGSLEFFTEAKTICVRHS